MMVYKQSDDDPRWVVRDNFGSGLSVLNTGPTAFDVTINVLDTELAIPVWDQIVSHPVVIPSLSPWIETRITVQWSDRPDGAAQTKSWIFHPA